VSGGGFQVTTTAAQDFNPAARFGSSRTLVTWYHEPGQFAAVGVDASGRLVGARVYFLRWDSPFGADARKVVMLR
jgi:hypothetical protein